MLLVMETDIINEQKNSQVLVGFFSLELVALTIFNLANLAWGFRILAFLMAILVIPALFKTVKFKKAKMIYISVGCLILYSVFSVFFNNSAGDVDLVNKVSVAIGVASYFVLGVFYGVFAGANKSKLQNAVTAVYIGLGLFVGVSLITTIYKMGTPFYNIIYNHTPQLSEVIQKSFIVIGFDIKQVSISVLANYALILSTGLFGILFIKKEEKNKTFKLIPIASGLIGTLTLILLSSSLHIYIFLVTFLLVFLFVGYRRKNKALFCSAIVGLSVFFVLFASLRIGYQLNISGLKATVDKTNFLKEFVLPKTNLSPRLIDIKHVFSTISMFGHGHQNSGYKSVATGIMPLDVLYYSGIVPFLSLIVFLVFQVYGACKYIKSGVNTAADKLIVLIILMTLIILVFNSYIISNYLDFVLLGIIFGSGLMWSRILNKKTKKTVVILTSATLN